MYIRLTKEIREGIKLNTLGGVEDPGKIKETVKRNRGVRFPFTKGRVLEVSDETGRKYIEAEVAEPHDGPADPGIPLPPPSPEQLRKAAAELVALAEQAEAEKASAPKS